MNVLMEHLRQLSGDGGVRDRRIKRMSRVDAMPPDIRALVHEWGLSITQAFLECGVTNPRHIRHIINMVLNETRAPLGRPNSYQGERR